MTIHPKTKQSIIRRLNNFLRENNKTQSLKLFDKIKDYCFLIRVEVPFKSKMYEFLIEQYELPTSKISKSVKPPKRISFKKKKQDYKNYLFSAKWKNKRFEIYTERGGKCERCKKPLKENEYQVHHKHYKTLFNENNEDLELLCVPCHKKHHNRRQYMQAIIEHCQENGISITYQTLITM